MMDLFRGIDEPQYGERSTLMQCGFLLRLSGISLLPVAVCPLRPAPG